MSDIVYPTRCRILDVTGKRWRGLAIATPPVSTPHVGKEGLAEEDDLLLEDGSVLPSVRITLDDGTILMGYECWWEPIPALGPDL
jgi:hypothetical protein